MSINVNYDVLGEARYLSERMEDIDRDDLIPYEMRELRNRFSTFRRFLLQNPGFVTPEIRLIRLRTLSADIELGARLTSIVRLTREEDSDSVHNFSGSDYFSDTDHEIEN